MENNPDLQIEIARNLKTLMIQLRSRMDDALSHLQMTSSQYSMLMALREEPGISGADLARKCRVTPQTVHKMLVTMEKTGWIAKEKRPDNEKTFFLKVTPGGESPLSEARPARFEVVQSMFKGFSPAELKNFSALIRRTMDNLSEVKHA